MRDTGLILTAAPIVEAVVDIDCDIPQPWDVDAIDGASKAALADRYPIARQRLFSEHQITTRSNQVAVAHRAGLQALQFFSPDERQIVQFRANGYSFNRLAPYTTLDDYLAEIERTWKIFIGVARPVLCRTVRLRYINRIALPLTEGRVELGEFLKFAPRLPDDDRLTFVGFFNQHSVAEPVTGNQANIVFATQPVGAGQLPLIFDIEVFKNEDFEPDDWPAIASKISSLRLLKNLVFQNSLTDKCLNLFRH